MEEREGRKQGTNDVILNSDFRIKKVPKKKLEILNGGYEIKKQNFG